MRTKKRSDQYHEDGRYPSSNFAVEFVPQVTVAWSACEIISAFEGLGRFLPQHEVSELRYMHVGLNVKREKKRMYVGAKGIREGCEK